MHIGLFISMEIKNKKCGDCLDTFTILINKIQKEFLIL